MKPSLSLSLLLNLTLIAWLAHSMTKAASTRQDTLSPKPPPNSSSFALPNSFSDPDPLSTKPFNWSQLESTNYRTYVANLRSIGCPEQTVRDIIKADVASLYSARRDALLAMPDFLNASGSLQEALTQLTQEEVSVVAVLLGPDPSAHSKVPVTPHRFTRERHPVVSEPLVLQEVDLSTLGFTPRQLEAVDDLRNQFQEELNQSGLSPADPAYRELWQKAQAQNDDLLQAMLGGERFIEYQLAARQVTMAHSERTH